MIEQLLIGREEGLAASRLSYGAQERLSKNLKKELERYFPADSWTNPGFDKEQVLKQVQGPLLEVGGPTMRGYVTIDVSRLPRRLWITNITRNFCPPDVKDQGHIDMEANATNLPFADKSIGAEFVSCLLCSRRKVLNEAYRVIEDKGLLFWQGAQDTEVIYAHLLGFEMQEYARRKYQFSPEYYENLWSAIFQKP